MNANTGIGLLVVIVSALLFWLLPPIGRTESSLNAAFWPHLLVGLFGVFGAILAAGGLFRPDPRVGQAVESGPVSGRVIARNIVLICAYVPLLFALGFYGAGFVFALVAPPLLGNVRWKQSALFAVIFTAVLWTFFSAALHMDLPKGYTRISGLSTPAAFEDCRHA